VTCASEYIAIGSGLVRIRIFVAKDRMQSRVKMKLRNKRILRQQV